MSMFIDAMRAVWSDVLAEQPDTTVVGAEIEDPTGQPRQIMMVSGILIGEAETEEGTPVGIIAIPITRDWVETSGRILRRMAARRMKRHHDAERLEKEVFGAEGFVDDSHSSGEAST